MDEKKPEDENPWAIWRWSNVKWVMVMLLLPAIFYFLIHLNSRLKLLVEWIQ
jgi:hypothetical protein